MNGIKHLIDTLPFPVAWREQDGEIWFSNRSWEDLVSIYDPNQKQFHSKLNDVLSKADLSTSTPRAYQLNLDGKPLKVHLIRLPSQSGILILIIEYSETTGLQKEIEWLFKRVVQLETFFEYSYDGLWICDNQGNVIEINRAAELLNDYKSEDIVGRNVADLVKSGYYDRSVVLKVLEMKQVVTEIIQSRNGKRILVTGNPIFDHAGKIKYVVENLRDITLLEQLHEKLEEANAFKERFQTEFQSFQTMRDLRKKIVFNSPAMEATMGLAAKFGPTGATVLITGESGVGKGLIAESIHLFSERRSGPFFTINCVTLPSNLIESELFGYDAGAFTGAQSKGKPGLLEMAEGGTLFLDEIGELQDFLQVKLLDFMETKSLTRIGDTEKKNIDVRVVCATNHDLIKEVSKGKFRRDLFYRLSAMPIHICPLRERRDDIPLLISHFLNIYNKRYFKDVHLNSDAINYLLRLDYPGNVRELKHLLERLVVLMDDHAIVDVHDIDTLTIGEPIQSSYYFKIPKDTPLMVAREIVERQIIEATLDSSRNQKDAARLLKVDQSTISRKMKKHTH